MGYSTAVSGGEVSPHFVDALVESVPLRQVGREAEVHPNLGAALVTAADFMYMCNRQIMRVKMITMDLSWIDFDI
jgi:hypothetical protein